MVMVTKDELKTLEQETRLYWLGLLVLTVKASRSRFVEDGLIRNITQGTEDLRSRLTDLPVPDQIEDNNTPDKNTPDKKTPVPAVVLFLDNQVEATSICEAIRAEGIAAGPVTSHQEACDLTADENVKVFVVDESFIKTATDTWRFRKDRVIPVAVIGSSPEREGWDRVVQLDADAYLSKDMSRAEQVARIKALLRRA